jgi:hypothetical protein
MLGNMNDRALEKSATLTLAKIREATNQMKTQGLIKEYATTSDFVDKFQDYIKTPKRCTTSNMERCFVEKFYTGEGEEVELSSLSTGADLGHDTYTSPLVGLGLANGTNIVMAFDPDCAYVSPYSNTSDTTSCMAMLYDTNGFGKPNKIGKDIIALNSSISLCSGVEIGGLCVDTNNLAFSPINTCDEGTAEDKAYDPSGSTFANCATNYWAGAKKACDTMGKKLPSQTELATLYTNRVAIGNFTTGTYFSSLESNSTNVWGHRFSDGHQYTTAKHYDTYARCVK